jgi:hypothetical protein
MCTLSFNPTSPGYSVAMNRDELLTRPISLPPRIRQIENTLAIYPAEPSGGTWIACNSFGNLLAILNWNEVPVLQTPANKISRGILIPQLLVYPNSESVNSALLRLDLSSVLPFRLIGIFLKNWDLAEWRWNGTSLKQLSFPWARKHWFSSSLSDSSAEKQRGDYCNSISALSENNQWLRNLHRSHFPERGPFSICVHRPDAATVSYTEVHVSRARASMNYLQGHPCSKVAFDFSGELPLTESRSAPAHPTR